VPLVFFGAIHIWKPTELNWGGLYVIGFCAMTPVFSRIVPLKSWSKCAILNVIIVAVLATFSLHPVLSPMIFKSPKRNRLVAESHGFEQLIQSEPLNRANVIFADTYQITSVLRLYKGQVFQWPGITRPSQLTISHSEPTLDQLRKLANFYLITREPYPPRFADFELQSAWVIIDCLEENLRIVPLDSAETTRSFTSRCSQKPLHTWIVGQYGNTQK